MLKWSLFFLMCLFMGLNTMQDFAGFQELYLDDAAEQIIEIPQRISKLQGWIKNPPSTEGLSWFESRRGPIEWAAEIKRLEEDLKYAKAVIRRHDPAYLQKKAEKLKKQEEAEKQRRLQKCVEFSGAQPGSHRLEIKKPAARKSGS